VKHGTVHYYVLLGVYCGWLFLLLFGCFSLPCCVLYLELVMCIFNVEVHDVAICDVVRFACHWLT
jgi:hypothetical protein